MYVASWKYRRAVFPTDRKYSREHVRLLNIPRTDSEQRRDVYFDRLVQSDFAALFHTITGAEYVFQSIPR
jgi:hypothetical protein